MTLTLKTIALAGIIGFGGILLLLAGSPSQPTPSVGGSAYETKERSEGNVTVTVTPRTLALSKAPQFDVSFETHSVELDFDVSNLAVLTDQTSTSFGTATWDGSPPGGHHRKGVLTFSQPLSKTTQTVSLTFANVAGIKTRTFTWEVTK